MNNFFPGGGSFAWFHVHWFFGAFALVGFVLLVVWAVKNLTKERLLNWATALLIIGILGSLLTSGAGAAFWGMGSGGLGRFGYGMMGPAMMGGAVGCQKDEDCWNRMGNFMERMMNFDKRDRDEQ